MAETFRLTEEVQLAHLQVLTLVLTKVVECRPTAVALNAVGLCLEASTRPALLSVTLGLLDALVQIPLTHDGSLCVAGVQGDRSLLPLQLPSLVSATQQADILHRCVQLLSLEQLAFADFEQVCILCSRLARAPELAEELVRQGVVKLIVACLMRPDTPSRCIPVRVLVRRLVEEADALQVWPRAARARGRWLLRLPSVCGSTRVARVCVCMCL